ncbi:MAG: PHB depolymerase family esterase [Pseudomonadota bacterium]
MRLPVLVLALLAASPASACGPDTDCIIDNGSYRIALPDGAPAGAVFFAHGYRGSAAGMMRNDRLRDMTDARGLALVALKSAGEDWTLPNAPGAGETLLRDEPAYIARVQADVAQRFAIDPARMILAGFSAGGMMTWTMACDRPEAFAAYIPISGTFWDPVPLACPGDPATVHHIHGTADPVVPIAGRPIAETRQGNVMQALAMYRAKGLDASVPFALADLDCEAWTDGAETLSYCLHPGGHSFSVDWVGALWDRTFPD